MGDMRLLVACIANVISSHSEFMGDMRLLVACIANVISSHSGYMGDMTFMLQGVLVYVGTREFC